jgi:hypothetical protein
MALRFKRGRKITSFFVNRDYAATLAIVVKNWFWGPLRPGKIPKVPVLEAEFSGQRYDSTNFNEKELL